ncbi:hypothetical protein M406DRAFT_328860 [Cryphonectria parasitica EP155]|uniref:Cryptic loci regulator 2 N-terminal domain-containing protein n=1 Tax=Cryphonectria parasitica (strain ATCC 38755 / EP155) TaxID=660469 RepID=A0A9P4Y826_CRYP1|nr:uncharacterized protein M406DRAFT_328860 [Cryphonectria parasitica EP155]KAF3767805.1 hypothetical protein M406DRAFT_328860 [Cryphonectria parasitica EP155]
MSALFKGAGGTAQLPARLIHVGRSDGRVWTTQEINGWPKSSTAVMQVGEPITEDLNKISDNMTLVRMAQWKLALGTGLQEQLGWPHGIQYQALFPDGFCLRWRDPGGLNNEVCMYGHPQGFTDDFLYRSPDEFIPHLLWLLSDSEDHKQCLCKPCYRATGRHVPKTFTEKMDEQAAILEGIKLVSTGTEPKAPAKKVTKPTAPSKKKASVAVVANSKAAKDLAAAATKPTKKTAKATPEPLPVAAVAPAPAVAEAAPPAANSPALQVLPAAAVSARRPPGHDEPTLFRQGEMVWYQQKPAWRIGIIRKVPLGDDFTYTILPLGISMLNLPDVQKETAQMRPFLTFSVPGMSFPGFQDRIFTDVNWRAILEDPAFTERTELVGLEASKLAAIEVDGSWSTFNPLPAGPILPKTQSTYDGVFLGAEMIRVGDAIRSKDKARSTLLEVTEISVTAATTAPNPADLPNTLSTTHSTLSFRGIEYEAALVPEHGRIGGQPEGAIFQKDAAFRTAAAKASGAKQKCVWTIKSWDTVWQERDVAGRAYVTDELLSVTQGAEAVETAKQTGQFQEATSYLNNRMQSTTAPYFGRRLNRRATLGEAVSGVQPLLFGPGVHEE